ncbi:hypothetical protein [Flavobacterium glaciei]|uniref:Uncharacterized protein n=1 Tax=Flavobacterium glaciei TaxID=386300 RepID=A0A562PJT4_9FLAO|nr:hypothetical protein [Flavobacterium glaciei]RDI50482.1 hypothetical protein DFR66_11653 [Flavobacterium glaciei]TWI44735.1 hypothetical protein IQ02_02511 [Flavobacterium glaciei]
METFKNKVIEIFNSKNENFKRSLTREFQKEEPQKTNPTLYKYREILIFDILKEISENNDDLINGIENPMNLIEEYLFNHINSY